VTFYLLGYLAIFYIAVLRFFTLRHDLPLTLFLYAFIGILGGVRFETGMDWQPYAEYFESISVEQGLFSSYQANNYKLAFEFGYFLLNYTVKYLGSGVEAVFLIASIFCALSTYLLSSYFRGNQVFIFLIYVSYNFIYMHFSTVRQSIAVGLCFIGLWAYLKLSNKKLAFLFFALSASFQISALLYSFIFIAAFFVRNTFKYITLWVFSALFIFTFIRMGLDPYTLLAAVLPPSFASKLLEYSLWNYAPSFKTQIFGLYICCCAFSLGWLEKTKNNQPESQSITKKEKFVLNFSVTSLMLTATFILLLPSNFALWTRTFNISSVLFACALSTFYYSNIKGCKRMFFAHLVVAAASFIVSLYAAAPKMVPYKSIL